MSPVKIFWNVFSTLSVVQISLICNRFKTLTFCEFLKIMLSISAETWKNYM